MQLTKQKCVPCEGGTKPLTPSEFAQYLAAVPRWKVIENDKKIEREFSFKNFIAALDFTNKVGEIAESEGHHPDILIFNYKYVKVTLWTHAIGGLSINDFILAAKVNEVAAR